MKKSIDQTTKYTKEEACLLALTRRSLLAMGKEDRPDQKPQKPLTIDPALLGRVLDRADRHVVLSFYYDYLDGRIPEPMQGRMEQAARRIVQQSYHLCYQTHRVVRKLEAAGVRIAVLKGCATAGVYPVPELRKSGDIDLLLLHPDQLGRAKKVLVTCGFQLLKEQVAEHHLAFSSSEGIELELHTMLAEPFDNRRINDYLDRCLNGMSNSIIRREVMGYEFPILSDGYHAFELLLHMLQHFLRSGFGLKLLCDWVVFWRKPVDPAEIRLYERLVRESRLEGFSDMVTSLCVYELGLERDCCLLSVEKSRTRLLGRRAATAFMKEILVAEEFGKSAGDRMVVMRSTGLDAYVREFHHQMNLNFPRAGKVIPLWPVLWIVTFFWFLRNNRVVRGVSTGEILRKARERSRVMAYIHLFEKRR